MLYDRHADRHGAQMREKHDDPEPISTLAFLSWLGVCAFLTWLLSGCADMPRGDHGEPIRAKSGWVDMQRFNAHCTWQLRAERTRITCQL